MPSPLQQSVVEALCASGISDGWKTFLSSSRPGIIYGAGRQATVVYDFCSMLGKRCHCLMAGESRGRWGLLPGEDALPLYLLNEVPSQWNRDDFDVIIAVNPAHNAEIEAALAAHGWMHIMCSEDWETDNALTRDTFYQTYLRHQGARLYRTDGSASILEYDGPRGVFKIYLDIDTAYKSALFGDFNNIVLPSVFGDYSLISAYGPYEHGSVNLHADDVVLDLGANIGMFSCVAASIGCHVHAFEPTPMIVRQYLKQNSELYDNIYVNEIAVADDCKEIPFYVNDNFSESSNITRNSVFHDIEPGYKKTFVRSTTVDSYVMQKGLRRVDFIKSHTEYAEGMLLDGAHETLSLFSPALSFYSQKFLNMDGWKLIEKKILEANPAYVFEYQWRRMFAWVPEREVFHGVL